MSGSWPYTTPTGHVYAGPTTYEELKARHLDAALAEIEHWDADECPPDPTWEMIGLAHEEIERLVKARARDYDICQRAREKYHRQLEECRKDHDTDINAGIVWQDRATKAKKALADAVALLNRWADWVNWDHFDIRKHTEEMDAKCAVEDALTQMGPVE